MAGMLNEGNSCYAIAVLQSMLALRPFLGALLDERLREGPFSVSESSFLAGLAGAARQRAAAGGGEEAEGAAELRRMIPRFDNRDQQDAHEFFTAALERLGADAAAAVEAAEAEEEGAPASPADAAFGSTVRKTLTCTRCGRERESEETFSDLSLDVELGSSKRPAARSFLSLFFSSLVPAWLRGVRARAPAVRELVAAFFGPRELECRCGCGGTRVREQRALVRPPRVLALHLKRFRADAARGTYSKAGGRVRLSARLSRVGGAAAARYELACVVQHRGTPHGGHYTTDVRDFGRPGRWLRYNDERVREVSAATALGPESQRLAYILFYVAAAAAPLQTRKRRADSVGGDGDGDDGGVRASKRARKA